MKAYVSGKMGSFVECPHINIEKDGDINIWSDPVIREIYCENVILVKDQKIIAFVPFIHFIDEGLEIHVNLRKHDEQNKSSENTG